MTGATLRELEKNLPEIVELLWESDDKIERGLATMIEGTVEAEDEETQMKLIYAFEDLLTSYLEILQEAE